MLKPSRPPLNRNIAFYISEGMNRELRDVAERYKTTLSGAIRQLLTIGLEELRKREAEADNEQQK
ncbi:MAG TPA: hypothetical protein G4N96_11150 [Chloroflexi bacterium]|nr:MAG: hypothetical protein B6243_06325 [Anaerolineaceae bacterium 4572_5.2]HEY85652.1 hypothetical protein [Chloroflexota bacterium]